MSDLVQKIKDMSYKVAEDYLLLGKNMDANIVSLYLNGDIDNEEVLKRVCEHANQNVYLGLFNNPDVNKSNIIFDIANFNNIVPIIRESETAMNDFSTPPKDFRSNLSPASKNNEAENFDEDQADTDAPNIKKFAKLQTAIYYRDALREFSNRVDMMKCAEENLAEESFNKMARDAKSMVARGESIGDISKIAARSVVESGGDFTKIAMAYDMIRQDLVDNNYKVSTEFTKISSMNINHGSEVLKPVHTFSTSISKIAALKEMQTSIANDLDILDSEIKKAQNE